MNIVRKKMCVELFVHGMRKEFNGYESGSEFTGKKMCVELYTSIACEQGISSYSNF
ncbi:hypothetical protein CsatB_026912 [Cannabis sativa]